MITLHLICLLIVLCACAGVCAYGAEQSPFQQQVLHAPGEEYADDRRYFGIASSITRTPGGRLWCGWSSGGREEGRKNYCIVVSSDDDGASWTAPRMVIDCTDRRGRKIRTDHLTAWTAPDGRLWIMWSQYPKGLQGPSSSQWCITSENPDDPEPRWSEPRQLVEGQNLLTTPTVLRDGTWLFPTGNWTRKVPSRPLLSRDGGKSFVLGGPLHGPQPDFDEYMVVERQDGSLLCLNRGKRLAACESSDGGMTWTAQEPTDIVAAVSRFVFMRLASGHWLLVIHGELDGMPNTRKLFPDEKRLRPGRSHLTAYLSTDEGESWQGGLLLDERSCSYPFGCQAADGTIYVSYEHSRWHRPEIMLARFTEADVLAGEPVADGARLGILVNRATGDD